MPEIQFTDFMQRHLQQEKKITIKEPMKLYEYRHVNHAHRNKSYTNINILKTKKITPNENDP